MRSGEEFDYFYEVDGELRYDFDCDYSSVEVLDVSVLTTKGKSFNLSAAPAVKSKLIKSLMTPGQTIIAN